MKIVAEIPARFGSKRIKQKNLRLLNGRPLIEYAIEAAKNAKSITDVYVNTESEKIGEIAIKNGVQFYKRRPELAEDNVSSDEFNYDFMMNVDADVVVMVNPVAPLITSDDIDSMVQYFVEHDIDTLIPVKEERLHTFCKAKPANFDINSNVGSFCKVESGVDYVPLNFTSGTKLPMTQDIAPLQVCTWTVCIWRTETFKRWYKDNGYGVFSGKVKFYPQRINKTVKISTEDDFVLAEVLQRSSYLFRFPRVPYDSEVESPDYPAMWLSEIRYIEQLLINEAKDKKVLNVLEWGSGRSTTYFSEYLRENGVKFNWLAIENFIPWYDVVSRMIKKKGLTECTKVELKNPTCEERKDIQEQLDLTEYLTYPRTLGKKFDVIIIDARRRKQCLRLAKDLLGDSGVVILHDAERKDTEETMKLYKNGGEFVVENKSPVPGGIQKLWIGRLG